MPLSRLGPGLVLAGFLLAGCAESKETPSATEAEPSAQPATAWWKTEGQTSATTDGAMAGEAKPGWAKLASLDTAAAASGAKLFDAKGCAACHSFGQGTKVGPDLLGVTHRVEPEWLSSWLTNPDPMLESDPYAKAMLAKYLVKMPNLHLTADEVHQVAEYFRQQDLAAAQSAQGASK